jgi:head-tail adaptor
MDRPLVVESFERVDTGGGSFTEEWAPAFDIWADVDPLQGTERLRAMQVSPTLSSTVRTHWREDFPRRLRFVDGDRVLTPLGPAIERPADGLIEWTVEEEIR